MVQSKSGIEPNRTTMEIPQSGSVQTFLIQWKEELVKFDLKQLKAVIAAYGSLNIGSIRLIPWFLWYFHLGFCLHLKV